MKDYPTQTLDGKWHGVPVPDDFDKRGVAAVYFPKDPKTEALIVVYSICTPGLLNLSCEIAIDDDSQVFRSTTKCKAWTEKVHVMPLRDVVDERAANQYRLETVADIFKNAGFDRREGDPSFIGDCKLSALASNVPLDHPAFRILKKDWRSQAEEMEQTMELFLNGVSGCYSYTEEEVRALRYEDAFTKLRFIASRGGDYAREVFLKALYLAVKMEDQMIKEFSEGAAAKGFTWVPTESLEKRLERYDTTWDGTVKWI